MSNNEKHNSTELTQKRAKARPPPSRNLPPSHLQQPNDEDEEYESSSLSSESSTSKLPLSGLKSKKKDLLDTTSNLNVPGHGQKPKSSHKNKNKKMEDMSYRERFVDWMFPVDYERTWQVFVSSKKEKDKKDAS